MARRTASIAFAFSFLSGISLVAALVRARETIRNHFAVLSRAQPQALQRRLLIGGLVLLTSCAAPDKPTAKMERVALSSDGKNFVFAESGKPFRPWGVNYGNSGRLMEDFWEHEWQTLAKDFAEIKRMGGNVVRVHLQFSHFMLDADQPNLAALGRLKRLLHLAEATGLYLDITGLACYRTSDVPLWYDYLSDEQRWDAQAAFWRAVAGECADSPAVFCYDLMNEPISPGDKRDKWYSGHLLGGYDFIQYISRNPAGRPRGEIAIAWIRKLTAAIREKDPRALITVGLLPWVTGWQHLSGFVPKEIAPHVDFISVHIYPKARQPDEAPRALRECDVGKAVLIEETFPLECGVADLEEFLRSSRTIATGWIWHYDGRTVAEYDALERENSLTLAQAIWRDALRSFIRLRSEFVSVGRKRQRAAALQDASRSPSGPGVRQSSAAFFHEIP